MLSGGNYILAATSGPGKIFAHPEFPGLALDLDRIFYRPAQVESE